MKYKIKEYILDLEKRGRLTFSLNEIRKQFPTYTNIALKSALRRCIESKKIISTLNGFYSIIPVSYALRETVPPEIYIDHLMRHLSRQYYVGLVSAASYYGAAHQQPQSFSVITSLPAIRDINKKGVHIKFTSTRKKIPASWLKSFRTENGDIQVSKPELTAADIITYQKIIGGLNRAGAIITELTDILNFSQLDEQFFKYVPVPTIQRLGFILEYILEQQDIANDLFEKSQEYNCHFQKIPLKTGKEKVNSRYNKHWKIIENEHVEIDDL